MIYIQSNVPNPNRTHDFSITNFAGGLNNVTEELEVNESPYILNMSFTNTTLMEKRKGQVLVGSSVEGGALTHIDTYRQHEATDDSISIFGETKWGGVFNSDGDFLITSTNSSLYVDGQKIVDLKGKVTGVTHEGKYFFVDGNKFYSYGKFDTHDTTYTKIIGTVPIGNTLLEIVNPPADYTPLPKSEKVKKIVNDEEVEVEVTYQRGVLWTDYDEKKIWYEPCAYEMEDTYSGANVIPSKPNYIISHGGRLFIGGSADDNDNVFISDIQTPFYFPAVLPMQLPSNADKIVGLAVFDSCVIVGRKYDIYSIRGTTNRLDAGMELFTLKRLNTHTGFANNDCFDLVHNYLFFLGHDGNAYALSAGRVEEHILATQIISRQLNLRKEPFNITQIDFSSVATCYYQDEWYVSIADKVLVYNYNMRAWTMYTGLDARSFRVIKYELVWGNSKGQMVKFGDSHLDFGRPFRAVWRSKIMYLDSPTYNKYFRHFYILADSSKMDYSKINTSIIIDYRNSSKEYVVENRVSKFGYSTFGETFVDSNINVSLPLYINIVGNSIQFEFSSGYDVVGEVQSVGHLYSYPNKRNGNVVHVLDDDTLWLYDTRKGTDVADPKAGYGWVPLLEEEINQPMKILQVNFTYEGRRRVY